MNKKSVKILSGENYDSGYKIEEKNNLIDLEAYLLKILPSQISMDQEEETIKCQAIILRTDLIRKMAKTKKIDIHKLSYQQYEDEQYKNELGDHAYEIMDQKRKKVVRETRGKVLTYKGNMIKPYFHAVSVGMTLDAREWFGKDIPYLKQRESLSDIEAKDYMTVMTVPYEQIQKILNGKETKKPTIDQIKKGLKIDQTTKNGYVKQVKIDKLLVTGEGFAKKLQLASTNFYFEDYKGKLRIICLGKGNGLGFSQYGANQMAKQKKSYKKILNYYYPKTSIKKLYE